MPAQTNPSAAPPTPSSASQIPNIVGPTAIRPGQLIRSAQAAAHPRLADREHQHLARHHERDSQRGSSS